MAAVLNFWLTTRNQTYTTVQRVFQVFRRRLDVKDAIRFANALPPILRAVFVADWDTDEPLLPTPPDIRDHHRAPPRAVRS
jgi:uncharacterized protein (DUF2267 family)